MNLLTEIALLTNNPETDAPSVLVAQLYRKRWRIETLFQVAQSTVKLRPWAIPALLSFLFAWPRGAYNLVSTLQGVLAGVHGSDCPPKLSYYYLAEERGCHLSGHDDCPPARRLVRLGNHGAASIFLSAARVGSLSQSQSFHFKSQKTEEEKAQTTL